MHFIGIDISKKQFDVALTSQKTTKRFSNDQIGFAALLEHLPQQCCCVMEATGPYYLRLATYLYEQGIAVSIVNPLVIRRFSQMRFMRTKTDQLDAKLIASYGALEKPALWKPSALLISEMQQEASVLQGLIKQRTAVENQLEALEQMPHVSQQALQALDALLETLDEQIQQLEKSLADKAQEQSGEQLENIVSIPGIGRKTAIQLLIITHGFTRFENCKQLCSYIGLSPRIYESGTSVKGKPRISKLGMSRIRAMLYVCAWSAARCNLACRELYHRLIAKGKAKKLALVAVANKLLKQAFAIANSNQKYSESFISKLAC
ncbi:MAG: IS110 family transposase [Adhaeribacter sp.]